MKEMLYAVWCLKSNEDMILALAGMLKTSIFEFFINYEKTALQNFFLLCKDVLW